MLRSGDGSVTSMDLTSVDWALLVDLLKTWAWPAVVLILGLRARPLVEKVLDRVKRIKAGGNEVEMITAGDVPKPQLEAPKEPQPDQKPLPPPKENPPPQLEPEQPAAAEPDLVAYAPEGAVIQAWGRFEETLRKEASRTEVLSTHLGKPRRGTPIAALINGLHQEGVLADDRAEQAKKLLKIRNEVAHGVRIASSAASQFVATTESLIRDLEASADAYQLKRIFRRLRVESVNPDEIRKVRVFRLPPDRLGGEWAVQGDNVAMMVTERDAALLVGRGATLTQPEVPPGVKTSDLVQ